MLRTITCWEQLHRVCSKRAAIASYVCTDDVGAFLFVS